MPKTERTDYIFYTLEISTNCCASDLIFQRAHRCFLSRLGVRIFFGEATAKLIIGSRLSSMGLRSPEAAVRYASAMRRNAAAYLTSHPLVYRPPRLPGRSPKSYGNPLRA